MSPRKRAPTDPLDRLDLLTDAAGKQVESLEKTLNILVKVSNELADPRLRNYQILLPIRELAQVKAQVKRFNARATNFSRTVRATREDSG